MEARLSTDAFVNTLASRHRVLMLGGMAVIAHGLSRPTKDSYVWLEPMGSSEEWAEAVTQTMTDFPACYAWSLFDRKVIGNQEIATDAADFGVIRIGGLSLPLDIFRKPNELNLEDFEPVWTRASELKGGVRLPSELDLYATKANTGRDHDWQDQLFLESLVKKRFAERLPQCDLTEAKDLLDRFLDPQVLGYAEHNPNADVREYVVSLLREFEAEGDPFSRDILAAWSKNAP